jgi:UDPglucose--hexose-1-phosphate uridylyltransferase
MSELRQDRTSGHWVVVSPQRGHRPGAWAEALSLTARPPTPQFDPNCPFCPGQEDRLPGIIAETRMPIQSAWSVRVVPNKFPAVQPDLKTIAEDAGRPRLHDGYGFHEVIIESPRHDADLITMSDAEIEVVVSVYFDRSRQLLYRPGIEAVVLFRNHGRRGGASLRHPHAQAVALPLLPPTLAQLGHWGHGYHDECGRCPTCDELSTERNLKERIIEATQNFLVLAPYAAEHPFEMWIVPIEHQASFLNASELQRIEFAHLLRRTLNRLRRARDDPPYNFVIDSATRSQLQSPYLHWRLRIAPDLATWGGFELGSGMAINPSSPERDAAVLRKSKGSTLGVGGYSCGDRGLA